MFMALIGYSPLVNIEIGPLSVSPHGLATALGFLAGARLMRPAANARGISDEQLTTLLTRGAIGALIGARLAYVVNHLGEFENPLEWLQVWNGGISLLGGIAGGVLLALPRLRAMQLPFWSTMDAAAPGLALGIAIGRIGDLVVGDHLGKPTDFALGFRCGVADTASPCVAPLGNGVHLPALYDLVSVTLLLGLLLVLRRQRRPDGLLILVFATWYGVGRFIEDFFRIDETHGTGLTGSQWASLLIVAVATARLVAIRRRVDDLAVEGHETSAPVGESQDG